MPRTTDARRLITLVSVVLGLIVSGAMVWNSSRASFTAYTTNPDNSWTTAAIALSDDDTNSAMFGVTGMVPGTTSTRCLRVTYGGNAGAAVRFYMTAGSYSGTLGAYLDLVVSEGPAGTFANATCTDWTTGTQIYSGTLADFATHTNFSSGLYNTAAPWSPVASGQFKVYKFVYTLQSSAPSSTQNATAGIGVTWEARSN